MSSLCIFDETGQIPHASELLATQCLPAVHQIGLQILAHALSPLLAFGSHWVGSSAVVVVTTQPR